MKSLESPVWFAPVQFMQTKKGGIELCVCWLKLSLSVSAGPSPWPPPSYNSVVDKRISWVATIHKNEMEKKEAKIFSPFQ